jgi:hypothetical protein
MILINSKFSYSGHLIQRIESFKILMSCFPILQLHRIYNKRLVLLETFLCAYDNYGMYSIPIGSFCVFFYGATKRLLRPIPAFFIPVGFYMSWHTIFYIFPVIVLLNCFPNQTDLDDHPPGLDLVQRFLCRRFFAYRLAFYGIRITTMTSLGHATPAPLAPVPATPSSATLALATPPSVAPHTTESTKPLPDLGS